MRRIIFAINMTLDGYFDHTAIIADDELHEKASELIQSADIVLYGRTMYQLMADYWPSAPADLSLSPSIRVFAETINKVEKIVFSRTLKSVSWNTRIIPEVNPEEINAMQQLPGKDILLGGGARIAKTFMDLDLIDEYRLIIHPIILGSGKRLFFNIEKRRDFRLVGQNIRQSGAVELIYAPINEGN